VSASITLAGESQIALKQSQKKPLIISTFIFANVPGLDPVTPIDRAAGKPPAGQIVHVHTIPKENAGYVNPNQVVYSAQLGSDIGDWDFNWVGLEDEDGVLFAVSSVPLQQKRKNIPPLQIGNNVTRNFLVAFDGALELTGITIDASTWQHDFTVRLAGIDERERLSNRDVYGRVCFFGDSLRVQKVGDAYSLKPGRAYIEGIRVERSDALVFTPPALPTNVWLDVSLQREFSDVVGSYRVAYGATNPDYIDSAGVQHYCVIIGSINAPDQIDDLRSFAPRHVEPIVGSLVQHFAARDGDYKDLRARGTTKEDVDLGNLPNAKSDDPATNSSEILATTAALNKLQQQVGDSLVGMVASFDMPSAPPGWLKRNGADVSRTAYANLFAVIGTRYGAGDGTTTFNVGDSRGVFVRGLDEGRGVDPGRVLGSLQQSQNLSHAHAASAAAAGDHVHTAWTDAQGEHAHSIHDPGHSHVSSVGAVQVSGTAPGAGYGPYNGGMNSFGTDHRGTGIGIYPAGNHAHNVGIGWAGNHSHGITVNADGGNEARPINQALLICIKY